MRVRTVPWVLLLVGLGVQSCGYELDTSRNVPERSTLGGEIFRVLEKDLRRRDPARADALAQRRGQLVRAVDAIFPREELSDIQQYLVSLLPLYDEDQLAGFSRHAAAILGDLAADGKLLEATWYLHHPTGYGKDEALWPLLRRALEYPDLQSLLEKLGDLWLAHDGLDARLNPVAAGQEDAPFSVLLEELSRELGEVAFPAAGKGQASWQRWTDFLLSPDHRLGQDKSDSAHWIVQADGRGRARVALLGQTGLLPAPFVDTDRDGLADIDPVNGDFVDQNARRLSVPHPFVAGGERPRKEGQLIYRYSELNASILSGWLAQIPGLVRDGILWKTFDALPDLLGEPKPAGEPGARTYDPRTSPLFGLFHSLVAVLRYDRLPELVAGVTSALASDEAQLARVLYEWQKAADIVEKYQAVSLAPHHRLFDDLLVRIREITNQGYLVPLLEALADPRSLDMQDGCERMIAFRDHLTGEQLEFSTPTDPRLSDADIRNRSNFQRMFHLTYDTRGVPYQAKLKIVADINVFKVPDMLAFYLDSSARLAEIPWYADAAAKEMTSDHPTTEEVNRFMNNDHRQDFIPFNNPKGWEGQELFVYNGDSLLAMEASGLLNGLRPMLEVFVSRDRDSKRTGTQILSDLLATFHPHYSSTANSPGTSSACANLRVWEPMLLEIMEQTDALRETVRLLGNQKGKKTPSGLTHFEEIERFVKFLLADDPALRRHDGAKSVLAADGKTPLQPFSRLYLLLDGLRQVQDGLESHPNAKAGWKNVLQLLLDRFLQVSFHQGVASFDSHEAYVVFQRMLSFLGDTARSFRESGEWDSRLTELREGLADFLGGKVMPQLITAMQLFSEDARVREQIDGLILHLLDQQQPRSQFELQNSLAWTIQSLLVDRVMVPSAHSLGRHLSPSAKTGPVLSRAIDMAQRMSRIAGASGTRVFGDLISRAVRFYPQTSEFPLDDLVEILCAVLRQDPLEPGELTAADRGHVLSEIGDYFLDGRRGLEKLYEQIKIGNCPACAD